MNEPGTAGTTGKGKDGRDGPELDVVLEAGLESFPASDPPAYSPDRSRRDPGVRGGPRAERCSKTAQRDDETNKQPHGGR